MPKKRESKATTKKKQTNSPRAHRLRAELAELLHTRGVTVLRTAQGKVCVALSMKAADEITSRLAELETRTRHVDEARKERDKAEREAEEARDRCAALEQIMRNHRIEVPGEPEPQSLPPAGARLRTRAPGSFESGKR